MMNSKFLAILDRYWSFAHPCETGKAAGRPLSEAAIAAAPSGSICQAKTKSGEARYYRKPGAKEFEKQKKGIAKTKVKIKELEKKRDTQKEGGKRRANTEAKIENHRKLLEDMLGKKLSRNDMMKKVLEARKSFSKKAKAVVKKDPAGYGKRKKVAQMNPQEKQFFEKEMEAQELIKLDPTAAVGVLPRLREVLKNFPEWQKNPKNLEQALAQIVKEGEEELLKNPGKGNAKILEGASSEALKKELQKALERESPKYDEEEVYRSTLGIWEKYTAENQQKVGRIEIPILFDLLKENNFVYKLKDFHALLLKWRNSEKVYLEVCDCPRLVPRSSEGIGTEGGVLLYVSPGRNAPKM